MSAQRFGRRSMRRVIDGKQQGTAKCDPPRHGLDLGLVKGRNARAVLGAGGVGDHQHRDPIQRARRIQSPAPRVNPIAVGPHEGGKPGISAVDSLKASMPLIDTDQGSISRIGWNGDLRTPVEIAHLFLRCGQRGV